MKHQAKEGSDPERWRTSEVNRAAAPSADVRALAQGGEHRQGSGKPQPEDMQPGVQGS